MSEKLAALLSRAESFIAGFEGDEMQDGVDELLQDIHDAIAAPEQSPPPPDPFELAARAAGWKHGGDFGGFWFHEETWGSWKAAASWAGTDNVPDGKTAIYDTARELCDAEGIEVQS